MRLGFGFGPVLDLVRLLVYIDPVQLWRIVRDGGNQAFAFPPPFVIRMRQKISRKSMCGRFLEFELFVCGQVDVKLDSDRISNYKRRLQSMMERWSEQTRQTLFWCRTTTPPSIAELCDDFLGQDTIRLDFWPRCFSFALFLCPWRTASVVPMIAGQAAIAVKRPSTITCFGVSGAGALKWEGMQTLDGQRNGGARQLRQLDNSHGHVTWVIVWRAIRPKP